MRSTIRLFKVVPISEKTVRDKQDRKSLIATISKGFIFSPEVATRFVGDLSQLANDVNKELGLSATQMNSSFHKSWKKIKEASIEQLVIEQLIHYFTTYGFEELGIYSEDTVYIPAEKLKIPALKDNVPLIVIKGASKKEIKSMLLTLLQSGIALKEETVNDAVDVATFVDLTDDDITSIKNREVKAIMYDRLGTIPAEPLEFLRYIVYKATDSALLIKNEELITKIKEKKNLDVLQLFKLYDKKYDISKLAEIFYRFKPVFLAFRSNKGLKIIINKIRRLAVKNHKPMPVDYLNSVTAMIKHGSKLDNLENELSKANIFRKIRLAYALNFRTYDFDSILYRIRNGKGFAESFESSKLNRTKAAVAYEIVMGSIVSDISKIVKGKKIFIPDFISYALPATEKMFTGYFPSGTCVSLKKDMIFGVHWNDVESHRVDLDLSLMDSETKYGWDGNYRSSTGSILFSGDLTAAPAPNGASELFYIQRQEDRSLIMCVNYFNYDEKIEVPFKIVVANKSTRSFSRGYMIDPNNVVAVASSKMTQKQKVLGVMISTSEISRFYFAETNLGNAISSRNSKMTEHSRKYLANYYSNAINLNEVLVRAGAILTQEKSDIDLSPEKLDKNSILSLLVQKI